MVRFASLIALFTAALAMNGCSSVPCSPSERVTDEGIRHDGVDELVWESGPSNGRFLPYDGLTKFHFRHELGVQPTTTEIYVSFTEWPTGPGGGGSASAAGNQGARLIENEHEVVVQNQTCSDLFVRVVVRAPRH